MINLFISIAIILCIGMDFYSILKLPKKIQEQRRSRRSYLLKIVVSDWRQHKRANEVGSDTVVEKVEHIGQDALTQCEYYFITALDYL